jgi:hypothetical protein
MLNRGAIILRYKELAVRWINDSDPSPSETPVTLDFVNEERTVYLIPDGAGDDPQTLERWLKRHYAEIFEMELEGWYTDENLWPKERSYSLFKKWFEPELHTVLVDLGSGGIYDEDA